MTWPLKVFIIRGPSCNLVARVLIRHPLLVEGGQQVEMAALWVAIPTLPGR